ncbi:fungal-specific transcription factor domain-containing protein [Stachybotrys elegans]|uniref:Fungal-specific transcription factor domain-containing protein n=1 Tax=Stachybotrys elegans TaxID=80388 RepID=A0A8K0WWB6_9HYPO|nr:fungal-specific transcription factor domain-containing protein [Stachybotrys elegans]
MRRHLATSHRETQGLVRVRRASSKHPESGFGHRVRRACSLCRRLKLKCDGRRPCYRCADDPAQCIYVSSVTNELPSTASDLVDIPNPASVSEPCPDSMGNSIFEFGFPGPSTGEAEFQSSPSRPVNSSFTSSHVLFGDSDAHLWGFEGVPALDSARLGSLSTAAWPTTLNVAAMVIEKPGIPRDQDTIAGPAIPSHQESVYETDSIAYESWPKHIQPPEPGHGHDESSFLTLDGYVDFIENIDRRISQEQFEEHVATWKLKRLLFHFVDVDGAVEMPNFSLPSFETEAWLMHWVADAPMHVPVLPKSTYQRITAAYEAVRKPSGYWASHLRGEIPPLEVLNTFMQSYFEHFHTVFPLLHKPTFSAEESNWLLVLAIIVTGCRFVSHPSAQLCVGAMQEFLRRVTTITLENCGESTRAISFVQAILLSHIGLASSDQTKLMQYSQMYQGYITFLCRRTGCFQEKGKEEEGTEMGFEDHWKAWVSTESRRRLGYCAWLLDTDQACFDLDSAPHLPTELLLTGLPCGEDEWEAATATAWLLEHQSSYPRIGRTLREETDTILSKGSWPENVGLFASLILLMSVLRDNRFPPHTLSRASASNFISPGRQDNLTGRDKVALLALESLGRHIRTSSLMELNGEHSGLKMTVLQQYHARLRTWVRSNGYEARKAAVHAGKVFAFMRNATDGYWTAPLVFLSASIYLWTFIEYALVREPALDLDEALTNRRLMPLLRLDKFKDMEQEQKWLDTGEGFQVHISGIGSINSRDGLSRLMMEASKLLLQRESWPFTKTLGFTMRVIYAENAHGFE